MASHDQFLWGLDTTGTGSTRVRTGYNAATGDLYGPYSADNPCTDSREEGYSTKYGWGHGTSTASVAAGRTYGAAKTAYIIPVRVINCNGNGAVSNFIDGLEWVYDNYDLGDHPAVVSMSIFKRVNGTPNGTWNTGAISSTDASLLETAATNLINDGVTVVASANNQNVDASWTTPARLSSVITVAGSSLSGGTDSRWLDNSNDWNPTSNTDPGSNWGTIVDIFAPASNIRSAHVTSNTAYRTSYTSGTSFAAPLVAGVVARWLQSRAKSTYNPANAATYIHDNAVSGALATTPSLNSSPNLLIHADPSL
jgi:serine protease